MTIAMSTTITIALAVTALAALISFAHSFHVDVEQLLLKPDHRKSHQDSSVKNNGKEGGHHHRRKVKMPDFVSTQYSRDGLREVVRVSYRGVLALENLMPKMEEASLFARQVSNGHHLVQLVYTDADTMVDCNVLKDERSLAKFLRTFVGVVEATEDDTAEFTRAQVVEYLQTTHGNVTVQFLAGQEELDERYDDLVDIERLVDECREQVRSIREEIKQGQRTGHLHRDQELQEEEDDDADDFDDDDDDDDDDYETDFDTEEEEQMERPLIGSNNDTHPPQQREEHHRAKRFIYPGTNWCGKGSSAQRYHDLGESRKTDKCCRAHDHCPHYIEGFSTKYNHFNFGLHTMSHCKCDRRFRRCLKNVNSSASDMVGQIFFNIMGNDCFRLKKAKVCVKRSWWGKCVKYKKQISANVLDAVTF